jgi:hypothetical protein
MKPFLYTAMLLSALGAAGFYLPAAAEPPVPPAPLEATEMIRVDCPFCNDHGYYNDGKGSRWVCNVCNVCDVYGKIDVEVVRFMPRPDDRLVVKKGCGCADGCPPDCECGCDP